MNATPNLLQLQQQNDLMRAVVVKNSIKMTQQIYSKAVDISSENVLNIGNSVRNAGLLLGFIIEVSGEVTNGATDAAAITPFGTSNLISQIRFDDLSNYTRIQTSGRHLSMLNTVRQGFGYGGAYAPNLPMDYGNNFNVFQGPASIAGAAKADLRHTYYVPVAYSPNDLRGALYLATVSAQTNLQIELNRDIFTGTGNKLDKVYSGNANGAWTDNVQVTVYQVYLDQIPRDQNGQPILPMMDLNTVYDLKETSWSGMTSGQDFPMAYSNFRAFLSTIAIYDNGGTFGTGSDVNYWSLAAANFTNIFKISPKIAALQARMAIMSDMPDGTYLFDSRDTPINTINFGNMELNINPSGTVNAGARVITGYEAFAQINQLVNATSLGAG
jgi:hypothetical protein